MEALTPPLLGAIQSVRWMIAAGRSPRDAFRIYLDENGDELAGRLRERWVLAARATPRTPLPGIYAGAFWEVMERGFLGEPILNALTGLEDEVTRAAKSELDAHLSTLPFKMLIPLLGLQFPAHLILLLGPTLGELTRSLGAA